MLHKFSIFLEVIIVLMALGLAVHRKKIYGWGFTLTFSIYVVYDLSREVNLSIPGSVLNFMFFIATVSALLAMLRLLVKP